MTSLKIFAIIGNLLALNALAMEPIGMRFMRYTTRLFKELKKPSPNLNIVSGLLLQGASPYFEYQQGVLNAGEFVLLQDYADFNVSKGLMLTFNDLGYKYDRYNIVHSILSGSFTKLAMHVFLSESGEFLSLLRIARTRKYDEDRFEVGPVLEYAVRYFDIEFHEYILEQVIDRNLHHLLPILAAHDLAFDEQVSDFIVNSSEDMIISAVLATGRTDWADILGFRILQQAIKENRVRLALFLLEKGADPNHFDGSFSLIEIALQSIFRREDREAIVLALVWAGANTSRLPKKAADILASALYPLLKAAQASEESPFAVLPSELITKISLNIAQLDL